MKFIKRIISEIFVQIIPVAIGVYLGFVVTDWADASKRKKQSKILVQNMLEEIEKNQKRLENVKDYHQMLRDSSAYYLRNLSPDVDNPLRFFKGIQTRILVSSAYHTGTQTGIINELPINTIQALNQVYSFQDSYNEFAKIVLSGLLNLDSQRKKENYERFLNFVLSSMEDIASMEAELTRGYKVLKEKLEAYK